MLRVILLYALVWIIPLVVYAGVWIDSFDVRGESAGGSIVGYVSYFVTIVVTLLASYGALKCFSLSLVKNRLNTEDAHVYVNKYRSFSLLRLALILFAELLNVVVLLVVKESSTLYLLAILLIVLLFCVPQSNSQILEKTKLKKSN